MKLENQNKLIEIFTQKASAVSINCKSVSSMNEALMYAISLCKEKPHFNNLLPESISAEGVSAVLKDIDEEQKIIAAPDINEKDFNELKKMSEQEGILAINNNLRSCLAGLDVSISVAKFAIADTATSVLDCSNEEVRLSTMLCEDHVVVIPISVLRKSSDDIKSDLLELQKDAPKFISFVSGPSRTADIERVLTLGVHGSLELHALLLDA